MDRVEKLRLELPGFIAILYAGTAGRPIDNNIEAYSYEGEKLWNIKDILSPMLGNVKDDWYPEMGVVDNQLSVYAFRGMRFFIDGETGELIEHKIVK
ncbi:MAG: hypothetical protein IKB01_11620 [Lachnospiraceae bacterium]|nr:hypothetical protein [Lachnospiraceae bacterium]